MERTSYVASVVLRNFRNSKKGISSAFYNEIKSHTKADYIQLTNFDVQKKMSISTLLIRLKPLVF